MKQNEIFETVVNIVCEEFGVCYGELINESNRQSVDARCILVCSLISLELSAKLVTMLKKHNWTNARIGMELGMEADEVLRLKQITGLAEAFKNEEFSKSWI